MVAGAVRLAPRGVTVALGARQVVGLLLEGAARRVPRRFPNDLMKLGLQALPAQRHDGFRRGLPPI